MPRSSTHFSSPRWTEEQLHTVYDALLNASHDGDLEASARDEELIEQIEDECAARGWDYRDWYPEKYPKCKTCSRRDDLVPAYRVGQEARICFPCARGSAEIMEMAFGFRIDILDLAQKPAVGIFPPELMELLTGVAREDDGPDQAFVPGMDG